MGWMVVFGMNGDATKYFLSLYGIARNRFPVHEESTHIASVSAVDSNVSAGHH
jgi:hypothetical protein